MPRWRDRLAALRNTLPIFRMVWDAAPGIVLTNIGVRLIVSLLPLAMLAVTKVIIDSIYRYTANHTALPSYFWWLVVLEFALACVSTILVRITDYCDTVLADKYAKHVSVRIMEHASRLDLTTYEDPTFQDKLERARVQGTDRVLMIQAAGRLVQQVVTTASLAFSICLFSPWLLVALVVCVVPAFLGETHFAFLGYSLSFAQTPARREMEYLRVLGGSKESAKELKLFGLGPYLVERFTTLAMALHRETARLARKRLLVGSLLTLLGTLGYYGTYAFVIYQTVAGILTIGTLTFLAGAIAGASSNIQMVFSTFSTIADQALFVSDLLDFFAVKPAVYSKKNALPAPRPIRQGFEFRNVSFAYPNGRQVLSGVSFKLSPGERIALVGENGQGKTTIVKLLTRLYDPTDGQILLDGVDLREYDQDDLWREIGVIFQDFMRYDLTATENIAMGRIQERENIFRIRSAAQKSLAEEVIRKLPKGYDQQLGCRFDGGTDLSGGEWQKLALARAYLRDAQVLILDEPTAALDAKSEHEVFQRFAELTKGKMSMLISHRFSTVRMADRILVLQGGRIAEEGPHDLLMQNRGRYAEMFELQAASYR
ncbi:MAG TPA: ABC transporter ATP-binding protein [Dongiaceae bacterium]|nr:ABC transporter ATP-binding protein [Dongiaceae bacterium]